MGQTTVSGGLLFDSASSAECLIRDSIVGRGAVVAPGAVLDDAVVGDGAFVGAGTNWPGASGSGPACGSSRPRCVSPPTCDAVSQPALTAGGQGGRPPRASTAGGPPLASTAGLRREWRAPFGVDVRLTLSVHRRGGADPAYRADAAGAVWRTSLTPDGPGTLRLTARPAGPQTLVAGQAWGPGAAWLLDTLPAQLGAHDDLSGFAARHPVIGELALRYQGLRVGRTSRVFEALVPAVLEQKVVGREAHRAWRFLLGAYGSPAPGPAPDGMRVVPPPSTWARIPSWDWHRAGVEGVRARTIITAAEVADRLEQTGGLDPAEADRRLRSLPGIGPWTSAEIRQRAAGDPERGLRRRLPPAPGGRLDAGRADNRRRGHARAARPVRRAPPPGGPADRTGRPPAPAPRTPHAGPRLPRFLNGRPGRGRSTLRERFGAA